MTAATPLLDIRGLSVAFPTQRGGSFAAVDGIDLQLAEGEVLGIVGESGSGKSLAMLAVMGLLPPGATLSAERMHFAGHDLLRLSGRQRRALLGREMAMIFQEPMAALNPCFTVGFQIAEVLRRHLRLSRRAARDRAVALLAATGIEDAARRARDFPHRFSGGMAQRATIAMALACNPRLLIADEPTAALDVTVQAQILSLLREQAAARGMALVLIAHDMAVIGGMAQRVAVHYAGRRVESAAAPGIFADPHHPYTAALLAALPERALPGQPLPTVPGAVPAPGERPAGCIFHPRCRFATDLCRSEPPPQASAALGHALCHYPLAEGRPLGHPGEAA